MNPSGAAQGSLSPRQWWRLSPVAAIAAGLVTVGIAIPALVGGWTWWLFPLAALGAFGPGILRELGWLRDKDESQRRAEYRAGYHAYLATGVVAIVIYAFTRSGENRLKAPEELTSLYLALLRFTVMQLLITTAPFFAMAWLATRWPRIAGALLVVTSAIFGWLLWGRATHERQLPVVNAGVSVLFVGPVLMSGLALLRADTLRDP